MKNEIRIRNIIITSVIIFFSIIIIINIFLFYNQSNKLEIVEDEFYNLDNEWTMIQYKTQNLLISNNINKAYDEWIKQLHHFKLNFNKTFSKKEVNKLKKNIQN